MLSCPVCQTMNDHLAITCKSCKSFLQQRIENLDLFSTIWDVIERPGKAFRTIALANHKNYVFLLSAVAGIAFVFTLEWLIKAGEYTDSLIALVGAGFVIGPIFGIIALLFLSLFGVSLGRVLGLKMTVRNTLAVLSYAMLPHVIRLIFILPIELMTFGLYFFTKNPSAYQIRPTSYVLLIGLDGLLSMWGCILIFLGIRSLTEASMPKAFVILLLMVIIVGGITAGSLHLITPST